MINEITLKDLYDIIDKRFTGLEIKVEKYHDAFVHFEEGKVSDLIQRVTILEKDKEALVKVDNTQEKAAEKRKDWIWGVFEKILFMIIGLLIFFSKEILTKLGILN